MVEIRRKKNETFEAMLRRFNRKTLESGKLLQFKKVKYLQPSKSRNLQKASTLVKLERKKQREYLKKIGQLPEEETTYRRR
ncbi:MAG TPA: 30S ribosomal protein S21 [Candidatus Bipolaricaulota bacterium]|nr:30S ribosomal protein S21 [Candidatus Bipolaricaulota bacterium]